MKLVAGYTVFFNTCKQNLQQKNKSARNHVSLNQATVRSYFNRASDWTPRASHEQTWLGIDWNLREKLAFVLAVFYFQCYTVWDCLLFHNKSKSRQKLMVRSFQVFEIISTFPSVHQLNKMEFSFVAQSWHDGANWTTCSICFVSFVNQNDAA